MSETAARASMASASTGRANATRASVAPRAAGLRAPTTAPGTALASRGGAFARTAGPAPAAKSQLPGRSRAAPTTAPAMAPATVDAVGAKRRGLGRTARSARSRPSRDPAPARTRREWVRCPAASTAGARGSRASASRAGAAGGARSASAQRTAQDRYAPFSATRTLPLIPPPWCHPRVASPFRKPRHGAEHAHAPPRAAGASHLHSLPVHSLPVHSLPVHTLPVRFAGRVRRRRVRVPRRLARRGLQHTARVPARAGRRGLLAARAVHGRHVRVLPRLGGRGLRDGRLPQRLPRPWQLHRRRRVRVRARLGGRRLRAAQLRRIERLLGPRRVRRGRVRVRHRLDGRGLLDGRLPARLLRSRHVRRRRRLHLVCHTRLQPQTSRPHTPCLGMPRQAPTPD